MTLGTARIGQIFVTAHDLDRAKRFYRDTLGMRFLFDAPNMAFFDCGGVRLMLGIPEKPEHDHPASILYYAVDDIEAAHTTLKDRDVKFLTQPQVVHKTDDSELRLAFFNDSEGNFLALMSET